MMPVDQTDPPALFLVKNPLDITEITALKVD
jgi:hypothetical protein